MICGEDYCVTDTVYFIEVMHVADFPETRRWGRSRLESSDRHYIQNPYRPTSLSLFSYRIYVAGKELGYVRGIFCSVFNTQ